MLKIDSQRFELYDLLKLRLKKILRQQMFLISKTKKQVLVPIILLFMTIASIKIKINLLLLEKILYIQYLV